MLSYTKIGVYQKNEERIGEKKQQKKKQYMDYFFKAYILRRTTNGSDKSKTQQIIILLLHLKLFLQIENFHKPTLLLSKTMF